MRKSVLAPLFVAALVASTVAGCMSATPQRLSGPSTQPAGEMSWVRFDNVDVNREWYGEASKRLADPIIFSCHGGMRDGIWVTCPDKPRVPVPVEDVARTLSNLYPNRNIVLICCNPAGVELDVPNVWYARSDVWCRPDALCSGPLDHETKRGEGDAGSIWEFVTQGKR